MTSREVIAAIQHFEAAHRVLRARVPSADLVSIEDSPNVVYAIRADGRLAYTNRAYREFAEANGAASLPASRAIIRMNARPGTSSGCST